MTSSRTGENRALFSALLLAAMYAAEVVVADGTNVPAATPAAVPTNTVITATETASVAEVSAPVPAPDSSEAAKAEEPWKKPSERTPKAPNRQFNVGLGVGKYGSTGAVGAGLKMRPWEEFGFEAGVGGYYYSADGVDTPDNWNQSYSGMTLCVGAKEQYYLTARYEKYQHNITLGQSYNLAFGPVLSLAYGFEMPIGRNIGFEVNAGLAWAPAAEDNFEKFLEDEEGIEVWDMDYTFIPVLIEVGVVL